MLPRLGILAFFVCAVGAAAAEKRSLTGSGDVGQAVDEALRRGSSRPLLKLLDGALRVKLDRAIRDIRELADSPDDDVATARLHVEAYASLFRFVAQILQAAEMPLGEEVGAPRRTTDQICLCDCPPCSSSGECPLCACICNGFDDRCPWNDESPRAIRR